MATESKCPVMGGTQRHTAVGATANQHWWPNQLNLKILHQNRSLSDPMGKDFNYAEEFKSLDLDALKKGRVMIMNELQGRLESVMVLLVYLLHSDDTFKQLL